MSIPSLFQPGLEQNLDMADAECGDGKLYASGEFIDNVSSVDSRCAHVTPEWDAERPFHLE
jgi:hypothetical protein